MGTSNSLNQMKNGVFINCPYDSDYLNILHVLIFLVAKFDCVPKLAVESKESSDRMNKILRLIEESTIGIHDISRMEYTPKNPLVRFNMPFELGIDYAYQKYCSKGKKKLLILESEKYLSKRTFSDLSGIDIEAHGGKISEVIKILRNFFCDIFELSDVEAPPKLENEYYTKFHPWLRTKLLNLGFSEKDYLKELDIYEYIKYSLEYVSAGSIKSDPE